MNVAAHALSPKAPVASAVLALSFLLVGNVADAQVSVFYDKAAFAAAAGPLRAVQTTSG